MEEEKLKLIQRLGEDAAYTFKGLYKESDWLEHKYWLYLSVPIVFSIVALGFDQYLPELWLKILAVISLIFTAFALLGKKRLESVDSYRCLAEEIKTIYDRAEEAFALKQIENYSKLRKQWEILRKQTQRYPIGRIGRYLSKRKIKKEMNLSWLGGEYSTDNNQSVD